MPFFFFCKKSVPFTIGPKIQCKLLMLTSAVKEGKLLEVISSVPKNIIC